MTVTEVNTHSRRKYNSVGNNFFSDEEIYNYIYEACLEMAEHAFIIERTYSTVSVTGQLQYSYPTNLVSIKRVVYDGLKLQPIDMREDDLITGSNENSTTTGSPRYYFVWNNTINLRPIPDQDAKAIEVYGYAQPQPVSNTSVLEIPSIFHMALSDFVTAQMCAKDQNTQMAGFYYGRWERSLQRALAFQARKNRKDGFQASKDDDVMYSTILDRV